VADREWRSSILEAVAHVPDEQMQILVGNLGGHDLPRLIQVLNEADQVSNSPVVIFAYTVKGYGLPFAGDPMNHSQLLTTSQLDQLRDEFEISAEDEWDPFPVDSAPGEWCAHMAQRCTKIINPCLSHQRSFRKRWTSAIRSRPLPRKRSGAP
jgi:pyruvate dehydrogenase E1 component